MGVTSRSLFHKLANPPTACDTGTTPERGALGRLCHPCPADRVAHAEGQRWGVARLRGNSPQSAECAPKSGSCPYHMHHVAP